MWSQQKQKRAACSSTAAFSVTRSIAASGHVREIGLALLLATLHALATR